MKTESKVRYPLEYKSSISGHIVRFRKHGPRLYEREDGAMISRSRLNYSYDFVSGCRSRQKWVTNINGFKVRVKFR